ncbi:MAG: hypothetical protein M3133_08995 [Actinomycetota bacterium]|nr:hypothetical protein [Actinomycetota bacterium]
MRESAYLRALETALHGAGLPYGYSVTVWASGAALIGARGMPKVWSVFLFAAGAAAAYGLLRFLTRRAEGEAQSQLTRSPHLARAGVIHVAAIGASVGAAALIAQIPGGAAWALASFAQTLLYLGISPVEMALLERGYAAPTGGG